MEPVSRRKFAGAAIALTAGSYSRILGANDRLHIGVIGNGGMATNHMQHLVRMRNTDNFDIVAVCDLWDKRRDAAARLTGGKPFKDHRALLDTKEIDYVLIAVPEHWHFQCAMDALDAGKHVYVEKPMTHKIEESKKLIAKIKSTGKKLQVGVQGMSDESYEVANRYVKEGALGNIVMAQIDYSRNYASGGIWPYEIDPTAQPGVNLDWNKWLGTAPKRKWDPDRFFRWRRYWDYSGGIATDLFIHRVTRIIKALDLKFPERAIGMGGTYEYKGDPTEVPDTFNIMLDYPGGPTVMLVSSLANSTPIEHVIRGHKATLTFTRTGFTIKPQAEFAKDVKEIVYEKKGSESIDLHHRNLQAAIRSNEPLKCDCMLGFYGVVACKMGVQSFRTKKYVKWDKAKERIVNT